VGVVSLTKVSFCHKTAQLTSSSGSKEREYLQLHEKESCRKNLYENKNGRRRRKTFINNEKQ